MKELIALKQAARVLRQTSTEIKNQVLKDLASTVLSKKNEILKSNEKDLKKLDLKASPAFRDRLLLNDSRIEAMAESLIQVSQLEDPVAKIEEEKTLKNGLLLKKVRAPLGVIFMIFESRPNVALEAFSLAFKAGNTVILRGGRESMNTTTLFYKFISQVFRDHELPSMIWGITKSDRDLVAKLLKCKNEIDVVVPRGGEGLINFVVENSLIPIIKNDRGVCHIYVHHDASMNMALNIVDNAKTQRPGVCNAMETLLVHKDVASEFLPALYEFLERKKVCWVVDSKTQKILKNKSFVKSATEKSWDTEYLDLIMNCKVVSGVEEAIAHIEKHGSRHSEAIVTQDEKTARYFQNELDSAAVYWNASTRFTDGFEFGLGGELGISTQKLHVRGPVGLKELTSLRWIIDGRGQVRE